VLEDPASRRPNMSTSARSRPRTRPTRRRRSDRLRARRSGRDRRRGAVAGGAADPAQRARPRQRHRPPRPGREPLRRDEVARSLRDAGRHDPARRPSRDRSDHARRRRDAPQGRADAALCELIYNGFWFSPEREMLQAAIDRARSRSTGTVRMKLYKGNATVIGRESPLVALRPGPGHLRGRIGELRPARRGGLHPAQRAEAADRGEAGAEIILPVRSWGGGPPAGCPSWR
jgi:hypothetical protein